MTSRRNFLRLAGTAAVAVGITLMSTTLINTGTLATGAEDLVNSLVNSNTITNSRASLITVKVYYSMMAEYVNLKEEDFVLQSPATLQNLIDTCIVRHPSFESMVTTMMVLLDGAPSKPSASLKDGDTVQFIPLTAGG
ncbi:MAG TPA: MoaD/ThiS family protein [Candidatus Acidoferrales bacterium]|nr:MoaD/ThiS family protein [Candidatus Acidoferrales bacterium]